MQETRRLDFLHFQKAYVFEVDFPAISALAAQGSWGGGVPMQLAELSKLVSTRHSSLQWGTAFWGASSHQGQGNKVRLPLQMGVTCSPGPTWKWKLKEEKVSIVSKPEGVKHCRNKATGRHLFLA